MSPKPLTKHFKGKTMDMYPRLNNVVWNRCIRVRAGSGEDLGEDLSSSSGKTSSQNFV